MIFSPDGHCRPFDASAEGTWAGNGLGCVVLRRLRDALLSEDPIIAVILSSAVNNDGSRKVGYTAPSVAGQQAVIEEALMLAAIDDRQIGYIETHGTGTPLGDAIEIEALRNVYAPRPPHQRCALGSVKKQCWPSGYGGRDCRAAENHPRGQPRTNSADAKFCYAKPGAQARRKARSPCR
ncbi:iron aquisition yersiniabactin synthesis enzyme (Irp1,polyketide synthetase) [Klebsiella oxytoca]|nr:iron aquisition yersiniabactin synthesis enzyme (Irp1,polyketide synthetase) [Klebsiella oxytoca]